MKKKGAKKNSFPGLVMEKCEVNLEIRINYEHEDKIVRELQIKI